MSTPGRAPVIGVVGSDVPRELVVAAGGRPRRMFGTVSASSIVGEAAHEEAAGLLGDVDPVVVRLLARILAGEFDDLAGLVVCNDSQAHLRLFYVLRMLARPVPLLLLDLPRQESAGAERFATFQLDRLAEFCAVHAGRSVSDRDDARAAAREGAVVAAAARLRERRRAAPPEVSGADALRAYLSAAALDPEQALRVLEGVVPGADPERSLAVRIHLTGSDHPDAEVYDAFESEGCIIVSDDHATGDEAWRTVPAHEGTPALVRRHLRRTGFSSTASTHEVVRRTVARAQDADAQVVVSVVRLHDDAPAWDIAALARAAEAVGLPVLARWQIDPREAVDIARELARDARELARGAREEGARR